MRKIILPLIVFVILLTACSSQPTTQSPPADPPQASAATTTSLPEPTPTEEPAPTEPEPPATETTTPTELPTEPAAQDSGPTVFIIVPGESQLSYEVGETFINDNNRFAVAIGVTPQVEGEITIDRGAPQNSTIGTITADISQFTSDSNRRDNFIRGNFLESGTYPAVTFTATQIDGLPESYTDGQEIPLKLNGDLTIREVTKPVSFDAVVKLDGDLLTGQATTIILMSDFEFGPISIAGILNTEDEALVTLALVARP